MHRITAYEFPAGRRWISYKIQFEFIRCPSSRVITLDVHHMPDPQGSLGTFRDWYLSSDQWITCDEYEDLKNIYLDFVFIFIFIFLSPGLKVLAIPPPTPRSALLRKRRAFAEVKSRLWARSQSPTVLCPAKLCLDLLQEHTISA